MQRESGMSIAEILIAIGIIALLSTFAIPAFRLWIQNTQVRAMAESIQTGLQLTRAEAVRRNATMRFQFVTSGTNSCAVSATGTNWVVSQRDATSLCASTPVDSSASATDPLIKQKRLATEGTSLVTVAATAGLVTFDALGRATSGANTILVSAPTAGTCAPTGDIRCLRVVVTVGGQTRMCDPARTSTVANPDPQAC